MNRNRRAALLLAGMILLLGCSREGFADSLSRGDESSAQADNPVQSSGAVYTLEEQTAEGIDGVYLIPSTDDEALSKVVKRIGRSIRTIVGGVTDQLAGEGEAPRLTLDCEVTQNDGEYFSAYFSLTAEAQDEEEAQVFGWGMVFDSATGAGVRLERLMEPEALSILLVDGPSVELLGVDGPTADAQRSHLSEQGSEALRDRLEQSDPGDLALLLESSFYLDGSRLVSVFSAPLELGGVVRASIRV